MIKTFLLMPLKLKLFAVAGLAVFALCIAVPVWLHFHDSGVVKQHEAEKRAQVNETVLEAERQADRNDAERRVVRETQIDALRDAREQAIEDYPDETSLPAGPAVRAVLDGLRGERRGDSGPAG